MKVINYMPALNSPNSVELSQETIPSHSKHLDGVTTTLLEVTQAATAKTGDARSRYSLDSAAMQRGEEKSLVRHVSGQQVTENDVHPWNYSPDLNQDVQLIGGEPSGSPLSKICKACKVAKYFDAFHVRHETGKLRSECKDCWQARNRRWIYANLQRRNEWKSEYYKQWRQTSATENYRLSNRVREHNRRNLMKDLDILVVQQVYEDNIKKYGQLTCELCFKPVKFGQDSIEHFHPINKASTYTGKSINERVNLGVAHGNKSKEQCNARKCDMTLDEWFTERSPIIKT